MGEATPPKEMELTRKLSAHTSAYNVSEEATDIKEGATLDPLLDPSLIVADVEPDRGISNAMYDEVDLLDPSKVEDMSLGADHMMEMANLSQEDLDLIDDELIDELY